MSHEAKRQGMIRNLAGKTGKDLDAWIAVLEASGVEGFMNRVRMLKEEHGLGHFQARLVVEEARGR